MCIWINTFLNTIVCLFISQTYRVIERFSLISLKGHIYSGTLNGYQIYIGFWINIKQWHTSAHCWCLCVCAACGEEKIPGVNGTLFLTVIREIFCNSFGSDSSVISLFSFLKRLFHFYSNWATGAQQNTAAEAKIVFWWQPGTLKMAAIRCSTVITHRYSSRVRNKRTSLL